jgi:hypothetical protein
MSSRRKPGTSCEDWIPVFTGMTGSLLEFIPMEFGAGMTTIRAFAAD